MKEKESTAYLFIEFAWKNENTNSYMRINHLMYRTMTIAIEANMNFHEDDFEKIIRSFSGGYWFGCNSNGKGIGEHFYVNAINSRNNSAIKAYEKWVGIKPFIADGNRMCLGKQLRDNSFKYRVTGFDFDKKKIHLVSYIRNDIHEKGKKRLLNYDNKEWLIFRKNVIIF